VKHATFANSPFERTKEEARLDALLKAVGYCCENLKVQLATWQRCHEAHAKTAHEAFSRSVEVHQELNELLRQIFDVGYLAIEEKD
jgi:hypothetical protein